MADREKQKRFNQGGDDLCGLLAQHMDGKVDSWTLFGVHPLQTRRGCPAFGRLKSLQYRLRRDRNPLPPCAIQTECSPSEGDTNYRFPDSVIPEPYFAKEIKRLHHRSMPWKIARYLYDRMGLK